MNASCPHCKALNYEWTVRCWFCKGLTFEKPPEVSSNLESQLQATLDDIKGGFAITPTPAAQGKSTILNIAELAAKYRALATKKAKRDVQRATANATYLRESGKQVLMMLRVNGQDDEVICAFPINQWKAMGGEAINGPKR